TLAQMPSGTGRLVLGDTVHLKRDPVACLRQNPDNIQPCDSPRKGSWSYKHDATELAAATAKHATFVSPNRVGCPYDPCPVVMGNLMMWRNSTHLTATFARSLWPTLDAIVGARLSTAAVVFAPATAE